MTERTRAPRVDSSPGSASADLSALLASPERALALDTDTAALLLGPVASLHSYLAARVARRPSEELSAPTPATERLLSAAEVAARLGVSKDWVYRRSRTLPFALRLDGHVRFSAIGLEKYLRLRRS